MTSAEAIKFLNYLLEEYLTSNDQKEVTEVSIYAVRGIVYRITEKKTKEFSEEDRDKIKRMMFHFG